MGKLLGGDDETKREQFFDLFASAPSTDHDINVRRILARSVYMKIVLSWIEQLNFDDAPHPNCPIFIGIRLLGHGK